MNSTRIVVFTLLGLVIGVLIGFGFRGSLATTLNLNAGGTPLATIGASDEHTLALFGILTKTSEYPNKTAPKAFIPWVTPIYSTGGLLSELLVRNLADMKAAQVKTCANDATDETLADCLQTLANDSTNSLNVPAYVRTGTFIH